MSSLSDYSDMISRLGDERRVKEARLVENLTNELPEWSAKLTGYGIEELFDLYDQALVGGISNPRILAVLMTRKGLIRDEIIRRTK
jgi:hypothetical protein